MIEVEISKEKAGYKKLNQLTSELLETVENIPKILSGLDQNLPARQIKFCSFRSISFFDKICRYKAFCNFLNTFSDS